MSTRDDIDTLVEQFQKSGLRELHLRCDDVEIYLSTESAQAGIFRSGDAAPPPQAQGTSSAGAAPSPAGSHAQSAAPKAAAAPSPTPAWPAEATIVRAPYMGMFYRAPKPGAPSYVEMGTQVQPETELCMVEVMKLFTAIRAGAVAEVYAILAEDGQMVQAQQPLFVLVPSQ